MITSECMSTLCSYTAFTSVIPFDSTPLAFARRCCISNQQAIFSRSVLRDGELSIVANTTNQCSRLARRMCLPRQTEERSRCVVVCGCFTKLKEERNNPNTHSSNASCTTHFCLHTDCIITRQEDRCVRTYM
ncbi:hypothetical protein BLNAU_23665 [Blattamonas nauphoetae]|uniref:Uncharacterized protein n=1 Tax=Blattamonas nauphoetae TaxID=2049346 RepID=A0ABQ9WPK6_9EUKA|nr:hypothetical protein BLNAU_23665 [Blattamonas nauphoetae]